MATATTTASTAASLENRKSMEIVTQNGSVCSCNDSTTSKASSLPPTATMATTTTTTTTTAMNPSPNPKCATLNHPPNHHGGGTTNGFHDRNNLRRSFTLPRSLFARKSGQTGPASENKNGSFIRHVFLTLTRSGSTRKSKQHSQSPHRMTNGTDSNSIMPNFGLPPGFTPGALGLKNQGNTCFMNAIVQCLSHTDALAKYLVTDVYKSDLRRKNWIKAGKGEVTEELATILRSTWLRQNATVVEEAVSRFKSAVEKGAQQWRGSEQHDAQEFLLWLLDRLHEDLNQAASNKYKQVKSSFGRPEEQVAAEALANHVRCNNSIIQDIFGAQFRSSLTCPGCGRQSATFDPFLCVSLPIPQAKQECPIYVNIVYLSQQPRQVKLGLSSSMNADIRELKQLLSGDTGIAENNILLCEIDGEGFHRTFTETQFVSALSNNDAVYCIETPQVRESNENDGAYLLITWCNILVTNDATTRVRFGSPYISQIARETGFADLQKLLLKEMASILQPGILVSEQKDPVFSIRVLDGSTEGSLVDPLVEHPLYMESVDHALSLCDEDVPPHIKIHLEWTAQDKDRIIADDSESVEEHSSVGQTRLRHSEEAVSSVTLGECFDLYTTAELLSAEDSWHCPHCNRKEQGTLKMIGLYTAPQVLVVHLKRFRQTLKGRQTATKLSTLVDFPVEGLDLTPHVAKKNRGAEVNNVANGGPLNQVSSPINGCFSLGHWKRASFKKHLIGTHHTQHRMHPQGTTAVPGDERDSLIYDLYAVCNHHGKDVQGGHYTAYCKNPVEGSWWSFDDTRVTRLESPEDVKTASAYILFYHRRSSSTVPSGYHWCRNLLKKYHKFPSLPPSSVENTQQATSNGDTNGYHHENNLKNASVDETEEMMNDHIHENGVNSSSSSSNDNSESSTCSVATTTAAINHHHHHNGNAYHNGFSNGKSGSSGSSSSGSLNGLTSEASNSSAPLARMEEIAIGLSLGVPKEVQIESTV